MISDEEEGECDLKAKVKTTIFVDGDDSPAKVYAVLCPSRNKLSVDFSVLEEECIRVGCHGALPVQL